MSGINIEKTVDNDNSNSKGSSSINNDELDDERRTTFDINNDAHDPEKQEIAPTVYHSRGVRKMDYVKYAMDSTKRGMFMRVLFCGSLFVLAWGLSLDSVTTYNYTPLATSDLGHHTMISTTSIATGIISSVSQPMISKISDVSSRPISMFICLLFYTVGYIITAASKDISAYIAGQVIVSIGSAGLNLLITIISADVTPLKYRGLLIGVVSFPYFINYWYGAYIAADIIATNWRWGYGMFAIILPAITLPIIAIMTYLEREGERKMSIEHPENVIAHQDTQRTRSEWTAFIWQQLLEVDFIGLVVMGFGWSLLLLPFSLYATAENEWKNPSLIAMFVVGGVLLIAHAIYEFWFCEYPAMPKRVLLNRTFVTAVVIDFFYECGGMIRLLYYSSYVYVIKNWSDKNWGYFNNSLSLGLCFFGLVVGIIQRYTHRAKYIQVFGLALQVISMGITYWARGEHASDVALVWTQLLIGIGGACSVVGSQVASQASVPHQDTALVISLLNLWSSIGYAIGSAIAGAIWSGKMYGALRHYLPASVTDDQVLTFYDSITAIRENAWDSAIRQGAVNAYNHVVYYLFIPALGLTCIPFLVSFTQKNYYLGDDQNAIESDYVEQPPKNWRERIIRYM